MNFKTRFAQLTDEPEIFKLYQSVAAYVGGLAREENEISREYISTNLKTALERGICLVINDLDAEVIIAEIHCYKPVPKVFHHVLSELTIVVHPDFQNKGLGKLLFTDLLKHIENERKDILRVELIARESNAKAIEFYSKLGFNKEGRFENRISSGINSFEADIPMAWFNKNFLRY